MPQSILASLHTLLNTSKYPFELQFSLHKCPKPSWQAFWPPHNQANGPFGLGHFSAPNHPGKRWDPPPIRAMPLWTWRQFRGASLTGWPIQVLKMLAHLKNYIIAWTTDDTIDISFGDGPLFWGQCWEEESIFFSALLSECNPLPASTLHLHPCTEVVFRQMKFWFDLRIFFELLH